MPGRRPRPLLVLRERLEPDRLVQASCLAYVIFVAYVANLIIVGVQVPRPTWLWLWAVSMALVFSLGTSTFVHETNPWGLLLVGFIGGTGMVGGLMFGNPLLRSFAGFALSTAYWLGVRRHVGKPYVSVDDLVNRSVALNLAMLLMNLVAYLLLPAP